MALPAFAIVCTLLGAELGARQAGPVRLRFVSSETAAVFRVVDQLSGWSTSGPKRFAEALPGKPGEEDRRLLDRHAEIRNRVGWQVTHSAFVVEAPIDAACAAAVSSRLLSAADAAAEREVLHAFEARVIEWARLRAAQAAAAVERLTADSLVRFTREASRFSASPLKAVDVYLVPSAEGADGAYTSGRIVLEVPPDATDDPLLHELWHAFAGPHLAQYQRAVQGKPRLDVETLSEAIAYAVQPGLFQPRAAPGALELTVGAALRSGEPSSLMGSTRPLELAVALRPSLRRAWASGTLDTYLPIAAGVYEALVELDKAALATPRSLLIFGDTSIAPRLPIPVYTRRLDPELLKYPMLGAVGIALVGRGPEAVPPAFRERLFERWDEIEARAAEPAGSVELFANGAPVFLWWERGAPDAGVSELRERVSARVRESVFRLVATGVARAGLGEGVDGGGADAGR